MAEPIQVLHSLPDARSVIHLDRARVFPRHAGVEESHGDVAFQDFLNQLRAHLRGHDGDASNFLFQHALRGALHEPRVVVCVAGDHIITSTLGANLESSHDGGEEWVLDVRDDYP